MPDRPTVASAPLPEPRKMHTFAGSAGALGSHAVVIVMAPEASDADITGVVSHIEAHGGQAFVSRGVMRKIGRAHV